MRRVDAPEILDSGTCSPAEAQSVLKVLGRVNRWFGGVSTTQKMVERVSAATGVKHFSFLEVAAGSGEMPALVRRRLARCGITLDLTLLDRARTHLPARTWDGNRSVVADALAMPFSDGAFDLVSCSLFAHHLCAPDLARFVREGKRVSRRALLINDLVRHPAHLALVYASRPLMHNRVAWLDGLTSVRRSYLPEEMQSMIASAFCNEPTQVETSRHFLYRMGVIVWKCAAPETTNIR